MLRSVAIFTFEVQDVWYFEWLQCQGCEDRSVEGIGCQPWNHPGRSLPAWPKTDGLGIPLPYERCPSELRTKPMLGLIGKTCRLRRMTGFSNHGVHSFLWVLKIVFFNEHLGHAYSYGSQPPKNACVGVSLSYPKQLHSPHVLEVSYSVQLARPTRIPS